VGEMGLATELWWHGGDVVVMGDYGWRWNGGWWCLGVWEMRENRGKGCTVQL
jgi:hypothetical protein